jgi:hypothetical protein
MNIACGDGVVVAVNYRRILLVDLGGGFLELGGGGGT